MRSILGLALSLGLSLLVTWAGLHYDNALAYVGVALICIVLIAYLYGWSFPKPVPVQYVAGPPEPAPKDEKERALQSLRRARDNGVVALNKRKEGEAHTAFNQMQAAMLTVKREFGIGPLSFDGAGSYRAVVNCYVHFIDEIYPLLKEGHLEAAKARANAFTWEG